MFCKNFMKKLKTKRNDFFVIIRMKHRKKMNRLASIVLCYLIISLLVQSIVLAKNKYVTNGFVQHQLFRYPIVGVNITLLNTTLGTMTDANGRFTISVGDTGAYTIRATMMGFETVEKTITVSNVNSQDLYLYLRPTVLHINKEIVVTANRDKTNTFDVANSMSVLSHEELMRKLPRSSAEALMETAGV